MSINRYLFIFVIATAVIGIRCSCNNTREYENGTVCVCSKALGCDEYPPVQILEPGQYVLYKSSASGARLDQTSGQLSESYWNQSGTTLVVNRERKYQEIHGFGGAFTDSAGMNIESLSDESGELLLKSYFSEYGIEYSMGRVPIGGNDFSSRPYTYDDIENDHSLNNFSLQNEDIKFKIPYIKKANSMSKKPIKLIGTAWTAPAWMKTNYNLSGIGFLKCLYLDLWADYHIKFLDGYEANNISFWGLTTGNEPLNGLLTIKINDMAWDPYEQGKWVAKYLGPKLRSHKNYKDIKIMAIDDQRTLFPWVIKYFQWAGAFKYLDGFAVHYYNDKEVNASVLGETHCMYPDKFILATEGCEGAFQFKPPALGSWKNAENYLTSIVDDMNHWVTGWIDWNLALDINGGFTWTSNTVDSPIIINATADEFYKQPMFYALAHFSKFVPPGSRRISSSMVPWDNAKSVCFERPDNGIVCNIFNPTDDKKTIRVVDKHTKNGAQLDIEEHSINTFIYWN